MHISVSLREQRTLRATLGVLAACALAACGGGRDQAADGSAATAADGRVSALAATTGTTVWTQVAYENQSFTVPDTRNVRYGAGTSWITRSVTGAVPCTNAFFGSDPAPGVAKACQMEEILPVPVVVSTAPTWSLLAQEWGSFKVTGTADVRYGVDGAWVVKTMTGAGQCTNTFFGRDPASGQRKRCELASGAATSTTPTSSTPVAGMASGLGMNLDQPIYWNAGWPFINELRRATPWSLRCSPWETPATCTNFAPGTSSGDTGEYDKVAWDAEGYPLSMPAANDPSVKYRMLSALMFQGDGGSHAAGRYVVLYDGEGTLTYNGSVRKVDAESRPGRHVLDVTNEPGSSLTLSITGTNPANHLRNIRVIGPGGVCTDAPRTYVADATRCAAGSFRSLEQLSATQTFHPAYIGDLSGFRVLRFMDYAWSNTSRIVTWAQRARPTDPMWTRSGVPYEAQFELAAATGANPWINVPAFVDDDFVRQLAQLAKGRLAAGALMYFEYGNEPWNQAPPYSESGVMFEAKARAKWPGATQSAWEQRMNWYAYRSVQLCRIVKAEFGADASRVRCVANSQAANTDVSQKMLACTLAQAELGSTCGRQLDALAIAPYFGHYIGDNQHATTVDAWANEPDGGMDKMFREITGRDAAGNPVTAPLNAVTGTTPRDGALAQTKGWILGSKAVADAFGLPLIAYEGGQHLTTYRGGKTEAMLRAANRDPRMGRVYQRLLDDWKAAGGQLYTAFSYVQRYERGGNWGAKEFQLDHTAPKWLTLTAQRDLPCWWTGCTGK